MRRRHHYRRRGAEQAELDMTTFLNLMVVLVPFLLITAVFSRITVVELSLPSAADGAAAAEPAVRGEVTVRESGLMLADNDAVIAKTALSRMIDLETRADDTDVTTILEVRLTPFPSHPGMK